MLTDSAILQRGLDTFAELGYQATSVRELAKRLEVSHNFINDRFGSKENFWRAVVDFGVRGIWDEIQAAFASDTGDTEKLARVIRGFYSTVARSPQVNRILAEESVLDSGRLDYIYSNYTRLFLEQLQPIAQRLMDLERMPRMSMDALFSAIIGPAQALTQSQLAQRLGRPTNPTSAEVDRLVDDLAGVILRGLLPAQR